MQQQRLYRRVVQGPRIISSRYCGPKITPHQVSAKQQRYLDNLVASFKHLDSPEDILRLVIDPCRAKIVQRCKKLLTEFERQADQFPDNVFNISQMSEIYHPLQERLRALKMIRPDQTLQQGLNLFFKCLKSITADKADAKKVRWVLVFAYRITEGAHSIRKVTTEYQYHRIRKLANYRRACYKIREACSNIPPERRNTISEQQVRPTTPLTRPS